MLWAERGLGAAGGFRGWESLPEVQEILNRHLDRSLDPSLSVRAVYGQWFPQLVRIDKEWAASIVPRLFPDNEELGVCFDAAWDAYVIFNRTWMDVFPVLVGSYRTAVARLGDDSGRSLAGDPRHRLGERPSSPTG